MFKFTITPPRLGDACFCIEWKDPTDEYMTDHEYFLREELVELVEIIQETLKTHKELNK